MPLVLDALPRVFLRLFPNVVHALCFCDDTLTIGLPPPIIDFDDFCATSSCRRRLHESSAARGARLPVVANVAVSEHLSLFYESIQDVL